MPARGLVIDGHGKQLERIEVLNVHANRIEVGAGVLVRRDFVRPQHVDARPGTVVRLAGHPAHHRATGVGDGLRHEFQGLARRALDIALEHLVGPHVDERHLLLRSERT